MKHDDNILTIIREFDAPQTEVFNAFADADALNEWWGPAETKNSVISLDFRPGGIFHFQMDYEGNISYGRFLFIQIEPHSLLEFTNAFADENANLVPAPFDVKLPLEISYRLTFIANNDTTIVTLTGRPVNGSTEEEEGFRSINASMHEGFGATFDKLAAYLSKIRN